MIQLTENTYLIEVPEELTEFKISGTNYLCGKSVEYPQWEPLPPRLDETGFDKFKFLGTITKDEIGFDPGMPEDIYRVKLATKGILFTNPYNMPKLPKGTAKNNQFIFLYNQWQEAESKVIKKAAVLQRI